MKQNLNLFYSCASDANLWFSRIHATFHFLKGTIKTVHYFINRKDFMKLRQSAIQRSTLKLGFVFTSTNSNWTASSEFGTYRLCQQRRFRRACASAQSHQNLRCSLIQAMNQEEPSDRKPDPWPLWMAGHAQLKFVMTECSKTQIRLTGPN